MANQHAIGPLYESPDVFVLADMALVIGDLERVAKYCRLIVERYDRGDDDILEALQTAAFVTYVRAFADGQRSAFRLDKSILADNPGALEAHQSVNDVRHKYIAHSVNGMEKAGVNVVLEHDADGTVVGVVGLTEHVFRTMRLSKGFFQEFHVLAKTLAEKVRQLQDAERKRLTATVPADIYAGKRLRDLGPQMQIDFSVGAGKPRQRYPDFGTQRLARVGKRLGSPGEEKPEAEADD